ncbi:MAG: hypothetical protein ACYDFU_10385 [Nitrospirota bacterium]
MERTYIDPPPPVTTAGVEVVMLVLTHWEPVGVIVYTVDPVFCEMVVLATPEVQLVATVPPVELVATERPVADEVSEKLPPVVLDRVTATLVALTVKLSASEPDAMVKVMPGVEREMLVLFT